MKFSIGQALLVALCHGCVEAVHFFDSNHHRRATPEMTGYPVSKVVELLRSMRDELQKEGEADEEVFEKLDCWCETNDKAKTKAIADAEARLVTLQATIEQNLALSASLKVEIQGLEKEIVANQKSLQEATAMRAQQKEDFLGSEKEMIQSIQALNAAVTVLSKHHTEGGAAAASALATIRTQLHRHEQLLRGVITPHQRNALVAFVQAGGAGHDYFDSAPTFKQAYAPQSGEIFGILRQMKATFEADLSQAQADEVTAQEAFANMTAAKQDEIRAGEASLLDKREQHAKADETVATSKADREDTQGTLSADEQFLLKLKEKCRLTDEEWATRKQTRAAELAAVNECIGLLSTDDARELFNKNFNRAPASFLQVARSSRGRRSDAARLLEKAASKLGSPKLSALATSVRLDTFVRVKKAIDDMVAELAQEKENEIKHRDMCIDEFAKNERATAKELHTKKNLESQVSLLELKVTNINETINGLNDEIAALSTARDDARTNRDTENTAFEAVLAEQRQAEALLQEAVTALKKQYAANGGAALVQHSHGANSSSAYGPPPPKDFAAYDKNRKGQGVLALLDHIISACKQMQEESLQAEAAARDAYTAFVQETTESRQAKEAAVIDRNSELAVAKQDKLQAEAELTESVGVIQTLETGLTDLHSNCDYLIKNFDTRQEARDQEVAALRQAKSFLSGME